MSALRTVIGSLFLVHGKKQNQRTMNYEPRAKRTHNPLGFTLIELLVAISIVAIISAIGLASYSQSQKVARDTKRKQDLRSISVALELYRQKYKRYPCPGNNVWKYSSTSGDWIADSDYINCADTAARNLDNNFISPTPTDPINSGGPPQNNPATGYTYGYRGYDSGICSAKKGQFYLLVTQLENKSDPETNQFKQIKDCDNTTVLSTGAFNTAYVITSE